MITTVTLNAAVDITYRVDRLRSGDSHRAELAGRRAGGKGVNVARVLGLLGYECAVTGFVGGAAGDELRRDLERAGLRDAMVEIDAPTRQTVSLVEESGEATVILEPGPPVGAGDWARFLDAYRRMVLESSVVVLSGSLPVGTGYAELVRIAGECGVPAVLDAGGPALSEALPAGPALVKPNLDELRLTLGGSVSPSEGAAALRAAGARSAVVSRGPEGLVAITEEDLTWYARPPAPVRGNPTGAGDAAVAALSAGIADGTPWPERLREAVALSAAAVAAPLAGDVDLDVYRALRPNVEVTRA
jgi:tagatose 6-phosphate kinase